MQPPRRLLDALIADGYPKYWLARQLGQKGNPPALQLRRGQILVTTAEKVRRLYDDLNAGRIVRSR